MTGAGILKRWRDANGFSQADVAAMMKVSQQTVSYWEQGRSPAPRHAFLLSMMTNTDIRLWLQVEAA